MLPVHCYNMHTWPVANGKGYITHQIRFDQKHHHLPVSLHGFLNLTQLRIRIMWHNMECDACTNFIGDDVTESAVS